MASPKNKPSKNSAQNPPVSPDPSPAVPPKPAAQPPQLSITISGDESAVRRAIADLAGGTGTRFGRETDARRSMFLENVTFESEWNSGVTRQIAREQTNKPGTTIHHTLGGEFLQIFADDDRKLYVQRCINVAEGRGHHVPNPASIPSDAETTVMEVGDALFDNSSH